MDHTRHKTFQVCLLVLGVPCCSGFSIEELACSTGLAGKADSILTGQFGWPPPRQHFEWYEFFGEHSFGVDEELELSFGIIPFAGVKGTRVALDANGGATFFSLTFYAG